MSRSRSPRRPHRSRSIGFVISTPPSMPSGRSGRSRVGRDGAPRTLSRRPVSPVSSGSTRPLRDSEGVLWFTLPERLPAGWYLVTLKSPTRPIQAMLQVTDIAGYLVVSETKTLVWANELATGGAVGKRSSWSTALISAGPAPTGR